MKRPQQLHPRVREERKRSTRSDRVTSPKGAFHKVAPLLVGYLRPLAMWDGTSLIAVVIVCLTFSYLVIRPQPL